VRIVLAIIWSPGKLDNVQLPPLRSKLTEDRSGMFPHFAAWVGNGNMNSTSLLIHEVGFTSADDVDEGGNTPLHSTAVMGRKTALLELAEWEGESRY